MTKTTILASSVLTATGLYLYVFLLSDAADPLKSWINASALLAFGYFLITFSASSINYWIANQFSLRLLRHRRYIGLGFAITQTFHLFSFTYFYLVSEEQLDWLTIIGGGLAYVLLYAMVATSNGPMIKKLGTKRWKRLHSTGMHYFAFIFLVTFIIRFIDTDFSPTYGAYALLIVLVYVMRLMKTSRL